MPNPRKQLQKTGTNSDWQGVALQALLCWVWSGLDMTKENPWAAVSEEICSAHWQAFMAKIHEDAGLEVGYYPRSRGGIGSKRVCKISTGRTDCQDEVIVDWFEPIPSKKFVTDMVAIMFAESETA